LLRTTLPSIATLALTLFPTLMARAAGPDTGKRLIQTSASHAEWMTPEQVLDLSHLMHLQGHCGGFMDITEHPGLVAPTAADPFAARRVSQGTLVRRALPLLSSDSMAQTVAALTAFHNRFYQAPTGQAAALWLRDTFVKLAAGRPDVTVSVYPHSFLQPSIIVRIQGSGDAAAERVVLGAHEDSINWQGRSPNGGQRAPGADDNASGIAALVEVFKALMQSDYHPARTVELMAYAGEELGLLGSQDISRAYRRQAYKVVGALQLDMTMFPSTTRKLTFITDNVSRNLTTFTEGLVDTYLQVPWQEGRCGYGCSDHASWNKAGYASVFPFEASMAEANPSIHSEDDTYENGLDSDFGLRFAQLATAFAIELGSGQ
jgi:leucyl aminopeptidase